MTHALLSSFLSSQLFDSVFAALSVSALRHFACHQLHSQHPSHSLLRSAEDIFIVVIIVIIIVIAIIVTITSGCHAPAIER